MTESAVLVESVDFADPVAVGDYLRLLDAYAQDPMGGGSRLSDAVRARLPRDLAANPAAHALLARRDHQAVGVATCFVAYSTFRAMPLMNIHDIAVLPAARGQGVGRALLAGIADLAARLDCCKLTLEVRDDNTAARQLYMREGFSAATCSLFMERQI